MRVLHAGNDYGRYGAAEQQATSQRARNRPRHAGTRLPLRNVSADRRGCAAGCGGKQVANGREQRKAIKPVVATGQQSQQGEAKDR